jgi:hypothetical protein
MCQGVPAYQCKPIKTIATRNALLYGFCCFECNVQVPVFIIHDVYLSQIIKENIVMFKLA